MLIEMFAPKIVLLYTLLGIQKKFIYFHCCDGPCTNTSEYYNKKKLTDNFVCVCFIFSYQLFGDFTIFKKIKNYKKKEKTK